MAEKTHEREHGLYSGEHPYHAHQELHDKLRLEVLDDREWMFAAFIRWTAWALVLIFLILAFLALTQT